MKKNILWILIAALALFASACGAEETAYTSASVADAEASAAAYPTFRAAGDVSVLIPGLKEGFVPQGITYLPKDDALLFAGYSGGDDNSALLAVSRQTGALLRQVKLNNTDGSKYTGHAGGVCATETDIYVSNAKMLYRISLDTYEKLPENASCAFEEEIPVPVNSSYCSYADGVLWVGEFQYGGDYPTDASHRVTGADGIQRAWTCGYRMEPGQDFSAPDYILSMTERIQGMTTLNGKIYLSQSYGRRNDSVIYRYDDVLSAGPAMTVEVNGREAPLWILDSSAREAALMAPPMTECLCTVDGEIFIVFESAAKTYMNPAKPSLNPMDRVFILKAF
ncbi:MAG: hypothetical protein IK099_12640 [Clostridia bacterium]|nr:hypothetical protein [Clostridia bacterium]